MTTESRLAKVLRLAAPDLMEPSALGGDAHGHLTKTCSFYRDVTDGKYSHPKQCKGGGAAAGVIYKMTPHTAEASTTPEPTVRPGGPGLFHHKGLQLPPYIQHLWHHLAPKYGKHRAYGMAVGLKHRQEVGGRGEPGWVEDQERQGQADPSGRESSSGQECGHVGEGQAHGREEEWVTSWTGWSGLPGGGGACCQGLAVSLATSRT